MRRNTSSGRTLCGRPALSRPEARKWAGPCPGRPPPRAITTALSNRPPASADALQVPARCPARATPETSWRSGCQAGHGSPPSRLSGIRPHDARPETTAASPSESSEGRFCLIHAATAPRADGVGRPAPSEPRRLSPRMMLQDMLPPNARPPSRRPLPRTARSASPVSDPPPSRARERGGPPAGRRPPSRVRLAPGAPGRCSPTQRPAGPATAGFQRQPNDPAPRASRPPGRCSITRRPPRVPDPGAAPGSSRSIRRSRQAGVPAAARR
jgi:hypothetical protein